MATGDEEKDQQNGPDEVAARDQADAFERDFGGRGTIANADRKPKKGLGRFSLAKMAKKRAMLGLATVLVTITISIGGFLALLPFKLEHIMKNLAQQFGQRTEQAISQKADRAFEYYVSKVVVRKLKGAGACNTGLCDPDINTGNPFSDVIKNWQATKFEDRIAKNQGIKFVLNKDTNKVQVLRYGQNIGQFDADGGLKLNRDLRNAQSRRVIKDAIRAETKWHQVYQRRHMRDLLRTKYGVRDWRAFDKSREKVDDKVYAAKRKMRQKLIDNVTRPALGKTGLYLGCLIESCKASALNSDVDPTDIDERNRSAALNDPDGTCDRTPGAARCAGKDIEGNEASDASEDSGERNKAKDELRNSDGGGTSDDTGLGEDDLDKSDEEVKKVVKNTVTKKILGSLAAGLGVAEIIYQIHRAVEDDTIGDIVESRNKLQYARAFAEFRKMPDQLKSGELEAEDVNAMMTQIDGIEKSRVYAYDYDLPIRKNVASRSIAFAAEGKPDCDDGSYLKDDELICQDKKVRPDGKYSEVYKNSPMFSGIRIIAEAYGATVGKIFKFVVDVVGAIAGPLADFITNIPGIKQIFATAADLVSSIFNHFFGITITGAEKGAQAFDSMRIGADVTYNDVNHFTIGGTKLNAAQVAELDRMYAEESAAGKSLVAKLFDTESRKSFASKFIAAMPSGPNSLVDKVNMAFANPLGGINFAMLTPRAIAQDSRDERDFAGVIQYGYPAGPEYQQYLENEIDNEFYNHCDEFNAEWSKQVANDPNKNPEVVAYNGETVKGINPCRLHFVSAETLKSTSTGDDDGGIGGSTQEDAVYGPGELISGSDKELACEIKNNSKIKLIGTNAQADINAACEGQTGPSGVKLSTDILKVIATMGKTHSFNISSLLRPGDSGSAHSSGEAIDITGLDSNPIANSGLGRTKNEVRLMREISPLLPIPSDWGQTGCGPEPDPQLPRGIGQVGDTCNHLHLEVNH